MTDISARRRELEQELEQLLEAERAAQGSPSEHTPAAEADLAGEPVQESGGTVKSPGKVK